MTGVLSPSSISSDLGIAQPTFDRYLSYLDRAFLVFTLTNYAGSEAKIQRRGRKLYFVDSAVRNAALQRGIAPLSDPDELGLLLENLVATSMRTLAVQTMVPPYWRAGALSGLIYETSKPLAFESARRPSQPKRPRALINGSRFVATATGGAAGAIIIAEKRRPEWGRATATFFGLAPDKRLLRLRWGCQRVTVRIISRLWRGSVTGETPPIYRALILALWNLGLVPATSLDVGVRRRSTFRLAAPPERRFRSGRFRSRSTTAGTAPRPVSSETGAGPSVGTSAFS